MKRILSYLFLLSMIYLNPVSAQVIDLSTGIVNGTTSTMIGLGLPDDTWSVKIPGTSTYQPALCGSGIPQGTSIPYIGKNPNIRWLSPYMLPSGEHKHSQQAGYHDYKMNFELGQICALESGIMNLLHIGADDYIDDIIVNGISYGPVSYPFNPFTSDIINVTSSLISGMNEIIVRSYNLQGSWTGMEIEGNLTITGASYLDAGFCANSSGLGIYATPNSAGTHTWEVYGSNTGNTGSYIHIGTYTSQNLSLPGTSYPCYLIRHTIESEECGTACATQTICKKACDNACNLVPPTNLFFDKTMLPNTFSWSPVPGAVSYVLEITVNDPACCGMSVLPQYYATPVNGTSYPNQVDLGNCFSWRVKAICEDQSETVSELKCETLGGWGKRADKPTGNIQGNNSGVKLYPNPARDLVTIEVETEKDKTYTIGIYDISGKLVKTLDPGKTVNRKSSTRCDTRELSKGTYLVKVVSSDKQETTHKLLIE